MGSVHGQVGLATGVLVRQGHSPCPEVSRLLMSILHSWLGLLAGLCIHAESLGLLLHWVGLMDVSCIQVGQLAGLWNHLCSGEVTGCVH